MARKPDPEVDVRIKRAATTLIFTKGLDFTMDEVAEAASVGRASVFRRYATKRDLLLDALGSAMDAKVAMPDTGSFAGDLRVVVTETMEAWKAMGPAARQMYGEAGRDPGVAEILREAMRSRMARSWEIYDNALARGEVREDADLWLLSDMFVGVVVYRGLLEKELPTVEAVVEALLHGFAPH
ncbi:TetR-like C-terminal domain-containing protein [Nonomuraea endophytica]|uniref:AcrR family transcriptional regulator n=1 Tax=Nonomuraea endophytica TaxID=714136 RepID=A0A7W8ABB3_9ACTN|nr:TetR-like C-terminal domain-containing protein [Nonomuraea endophytica]MBB5082055.1 AcrR family transcriptional regulator [Nonomuraea endophytica]